MLTKLGAARSESQHALVLILAPGELEQVRQVKCMDAPKQLTHPQTVIFLTAPPFNSGGRVP